MRATSKATARACGVLRSSAMAAQNRSRNGCADRGSGSRPLARRVVAGLGRASAEAVEGGLRAAQRVEREVLLRAVVGLEHEEAEDQRIEALVDQVGEHERVARSTWRSCRRRASGTRGAPSTAPTGAGAASTRSGRSRWCGAPRCGRRRRCGGRTGHPGTWWTWPSTRCASPGSRRPTASPTPAGAARPRARTSRGRSRRGGASARRPRPGRWSPSRRGPGR